MTPRQKRFAFSGCGVLLVLVLAAPLLFSNDEKAVRKRIALLEKRIAREPGDGTIALARKADGLRGLFAEECRLKTHVAEFTGTFTPRELAKLALDFWLQTSQVSVVLDVSKIEFPAPDRAEVLMSLKMRGKLPAGDDFAENHGMIVTLEKMDRQWLFARVEVIQTKAK